MTSNKLDFDEALHAAKEQKYISSLRLELSRNRSRDMDQCVKGSWLLTKIEKGILD